LVSAITMPIIKEGNPAERLVLIAVWF
jgi:hypothetical protein